MVSSISEIVHSIFGRNPWTIVRRFDQISLHTHNSSMEGAMKLKLASFCSTWDALSDGIIDFRNRSFNFWPKSLDYSKAF